MVRPIGSCDMLRAAGKGPYAMKPYAMDPGDAPKPADAQSSSAKRAACEDDGNDALIAREILRLCSERGPEKSICPSEAAKAVAHLIGGSGEAAARPFDAQWRGLMDDVRRVARALARNGRIDVMQRGTRIDPSDPPPKGPIRLRLCDRSNGAG